MEQIAELFEPTLNAIKNLEGSKYVTQSLILLEMCMIENSIFEMQKKCMTFALYILLSTDPKELNKQLHVVMVDLLDSLNDLWDALPAESVIASILDPRTKFFDRIPDNEIKEALQMMKKVLVQ